MRILRIIAILISVFCMGKSFCEERNFTFFENDGKRHSLNDQLEFLKDESGKLNINDVINNKNFGRNESIGYEYKNEVLWVKFSLDFRNYSEKIWFLYYNYEHVGNMKIYYLMNDKIESQEIDEKLPFEGRMFDSREYIFKIPVSNTSSATYYIRFMPGSRFLKVDLSRSDSKGIIDSIRESDFIYALFFGGMLVLLFYNTALCLFLKDKAYFFYIYYLSFFIIVIFHIYGFSSYIFKLNRLWEQFFAFCGYAAIQGMILFARHFLVLKSHMNLADKYLLFLQWLLLIFGFGAFFQPIGQPFEYLNFFILFVLPVLMFCGIYRWYQGYAPAKIYSFGWIIFSVALALLSARSIGWLPANIVTNHAIMVASIWEAIMFSLALGYRIKLLDKEKKESLEIERNLLEHRVAERTESLKASLESRRMMLANASHELRTPVNALRLLLDSGSDSVSSDIEMIGNVSTIANHMSQLVENLLLLDEGSHASQPGLSQDFDLGDEIRATAAMLGPLRHNSGASFHLDVDACSGMIVRGDLTSLRRVIINLLSNAFKFTEDGSVSLVASIGEASAVDKLHVVIRVVDTGLGISLSMRDQIFGAFVTSGVQGGHTGTGLGLAISRQLAQNMGGDLILVRSELSVGSEFEFRACFEVVVYSQASSSDGQLPPRGSSCAGQLNVLVAEDDPLTAQAVLVIVKQLRHVATHVETYDELCRALRRPEGTYDVALIDHRLPGGNGLGAIADCRVAGIAATTRMVLVTADVTPEVLKAAKDICDNIITKPTTGQVLRQLLGEGPWSEHPVADLREMVDAGPLTMLGHCGAQYQALARMCATFNKTMGDALIEIDGRLGEKGDLDLAELASLIHRIRGSCATIGATVLAEELQKFAACDNRATAQRQYALTVDTFYNTRRALHALLATLRTT